MKKAVLILFVACMSLWGCANEETTNEAPGKSSSQPEKIAEPASATPVEPFQFGCRSMPPAKDRTIPKSELLIRADDREMKADEFNNAQPLAEDQLTGYTIAAVSSVPEEQL